MIHHVVDDHHFKDEGLFYRFYLDEEGSAATTAKNHEYKESRETARAALHLHGLLRLTKVLIADRPWHLTMYKQCFVASQFVAWLVQTGELGS